MSTDRTLREILELLEPSRLRGRVALPWDEIREEFIPRFLATDSYEEFISEVGRFIATAKQRWLSTDMKWPADYAQSEARRLLEDSMGVQEAMRAVRHGDKGGMRSVLDNVAQALQTEALNQYLEHHVLPAIQSLDANESTALAEAYSREFKSIGIGVEHPAVIASQWRTILSNHAATVLTNSV